MKICVVGDGVMGGGIVQAIVQSGYELVWKGYNDETLGRAQERLDKNLLRLLDKEIIDKVEKDAISNRITTTLKYEDCKDCDIAIEVI